LLRYAAFTLSQFRLPLPPAQPSLPQYAPPGAAERYAIDVFSSDARHLPFSEPRWAEVAGVSSSSTRPVSILLPL